MGNHENTEIGDFIRDYLDLDLGAITAQLKSHDDDDAATNAQITEGGGKQWKGKPFALSKSEAEQDHYHGDFKRSLECGCLQ